MSDLQDALIRFGQSVRNRFRPPVNSKGLLLTSDPEGLGSRPGVRPVGFVESDEELDFQMNAEEDFEEIFNNWQRISRQGPGSTDTANVSELDEWTYNSSTGNVVCTKNTATLVGFISDYLYNNYTLGVRLSSTAGDDDFIGLCIAHAVDDLGNTHILTAMRGLNGRAPLVIDKNLYAFAAADSWINNPSDYEVARVYSGLQWANGSVASVPVANGSSGGWSTLSNGLLLRVTRDEDTITIETSRNDGTAYHEPATTVIDLSLDPELEIFRGPQRYGYVCFSQPNSTFDTLERTTDRRPLIDLRDFTIYEQVGSDWVETQTSIQDLLTRGVLQPNQLHLNPITGRFYYMRGSEELLPVNLP